MANIPKLRLMLARMEKAASARWRTLQGLTALLGKDTVATTPRIGALQLAARKQGITSLPGEGFAKAMSSLPERPPGLKFDDLSLREPSQIFRGGNQPADLIRGGYSTEHLHATPFKNVAEAFGKIEKQPNLFGPPNRSLYNEGGFIYNPRTLIGVYDTAKNQRYTRDYGMERNPAQLMGTDRLDSTAGLSYAYRALQDRNKLKKMNEKGWPVGMTGISPTPSPKQLALQAHLSNRYETLVKPSQLHSILLDNRVLPATAKGRELLQTGTMPASAQLPPEILKGRELLQTSAMPASAQLPATSGQGVRTFPEIQQFLRKRYAAPAAPAAPVAPATSPSLWSKMLNYFQNFSMPAGAQLPPEIIKSASWMDMVQRAIAKLPGRTPQASQLGKQLYRGFPLGAEETGFKGIEHASLHPSVAAGHAEDSGGLLRYVLKKFDADPQVQKHFPHRGLLSSLGFPGRAAEVKTNPIGYNFRTTGRTIPEVQQFLKDNPIYHIPKAQASPANYPIWAEASREHGAKGLGHLGYDAGYEWSTVPAKGWNLFGGQGSTKTLFKDLTHETGVHTDNFSGLVSFNPNTNKLADIPHNIAKDLIKGAGWMDMVQRAIAKLPGRAVPTTPIGKVVYRGFQPAVADARFPIVHASAHPQVASRYTMPLQDWSENSFGAPSANFANWAKNNGQEHRILRTFGVDPQVQKHFPQLGFLSMDDRSKHSFRNAAQIAFNLGGRTMPEIQQFLKKTPWYQKKLPERLMLEQMSYETGVPSNSFTGLSSYNPLTRTVADIPHNIAKDLIKGAGVFTASGNKVQGVGLRKLYHSLLDERGLTGLGVNNEDTGDVELSFDGDEARRKEVFKELAARIKAKTNHPVTFAPTTVPQTSTPVKLSNKDSERLNAIHHLAYRMSNMYDPTHPLMDPNDTFKQKLADRFRLQVNKRGLTGTVPSRAAEQLLGTRPMYAGMMPARRTRSEAEALSDMPMEQQQRLFKALKSGRGFLAPVVDKLASAAVKAPMNLYSYIPNGSIEHVKKHGLLSGNELAKPENRHLLDIARPDGDADRWLKERDARLAKSPWTNSYNGPSAFFGDIDAGKIHDKHPIKKFNTTRAVIKLRELLRDYPATKMEGSELIPFSDTTYDALDEKGRNEFVNKRHHTLSLDEIKALLTRGQNPKDMWKDFKDTEGKYYASDVPHAQVVTPMGKIPSKYIEFK